MKGRSLAHNEVIQQYSQPTQPVSGETEGGDSATAPDEWAVANSVMDERIEARFRANASAEGRIKESNAQYTIGWQEAYSAMHSDKESWEPVLAAKRDVIQKSLSRNHSWLSSFLGCFASHIGSGTDEAKERDFLLTLQYVELSHDCPIHQRIVRTIYQRITGERGATPTTGSHMEKVGFQGPNPATDLRSTGLTGLLIVHRFSVEHARLISRAFEASQNPMREFPLALVLLNFTAIAVESLKEKVLDHEVGRVRKRSPNPEATVFSVLSDFTAGIFLLFFEEWISVPQRRITDFADIKKRLHAFAKKSPSKVFEAAKRARHPQAGAGQSKPAAPVSKSESVEFSTF